MVDCVLPVISPTKALVRAQQRWHLHDERGLVRERAAHEYDVGALTIVALSLMASGRDRALGSARICEDSARIRYGSAPVATAESRGLFRARSRLSRAAGSLARSLPAGRFLATVQEAPLGSFEQPHFRLLSTTRLHDRRHALVEAAVSSFSYQARLAPAAKASAP
ncbi:MAG: hypothetical protein JWN04_5800 [Myxococcaceae bacterium]|nr:hypothetical protein [Myxococcaceae bacterium]